VITRIPSTQGIGARHGGAVVSTHNSDGLQVEQVTLALQMHFLQSYGGIPIRPKSTSGALAPWQLRVAEEVLMAHLASRISVAQIASECGLSVGHFSRAFKSSTGLSPHHWLVSRRIEKAADLLRHSALSVAEVGLICGFSDQSHFTRVFARAKGAPPAQWRRAKGRKPMRDQAVVAPGSSLSAVP
jgi:AraC family transcriptional regulator